MGQYYQPPPPGYAAPPPQPYNMEPPEAGSIKSMSNIASIFGIIICVIALLFALVELYWYATWESVNNYYYDYYDIYDDTVRTAYIIWAVVLLVMFIFGIIFFMQCRKISEMVNQRQYQQAKSKTLVWTIIGFIFVGIIPGILLLIAYLKFDTLIRSTQTQAYGPAPQPYAQPPPPGYGAPPPQQHGYKACMGCGAQIPANSYACPHCGRQG